MKGFCFFLPILTVDAALRVRDCVSSGLNDTARTSIRCSSFDLAIFLARRTTGNVFADQSIVLVVAGLAAMWPKVVIDAVNCDDSNQPNAIFQFPTLASVFGARI